MARRKKPPEHENHERWLVSYADFITLLFAFFVVMFASSQSDKGKAEQVSQAVTRALEQGGVGALVNAVLGGTVDNVGQGNAQKRGPGGAKKTEGEVKPPGGGPHDGKGQGEELQKAMDALMGELAEELAAGKMQVSLEARGLVISFREAAFFRSGEAAIQESNMAAAEKVAGVLRQLSNPVRLEGHTDSVPIHNARFQSNWELAAARSIAMLELYAGRYGIPKDRMSIAAYAENAPMASNGTEEGRARNRRVDIVLLSSIGKQGEPQTAHGADNPAGQQAAAAVPPEGGERQKRKSGHH
ncbi:MAG: OmpA family protein [Bryobacteraceae bacterium]|nr:OmpA family protein [Bryobacteraceae bacterium]